MLGNSIYLRMEVVVVASTVVALAILAAITGYIVSNVATVAAYFIFVGMGLFSLLLSLGVGSYGMIKNLLLLGCDQWNIRMVRSGFIIQIVLLCIGLLFYSISLFFIR